ncbi:hypothetical protein NNO_0973 [Hydrogenimonas sp.]|nr:hypothetical protein NNO_0973 [Hydrogenimonas sp.]
MRYFSGFCLEGESALFDEIIGDSKDNPYVVAGFSFGAIGALEYALSTERRIDRLILLSPSYFVGSQKSFIKAQLFYFKKDSDSYIRKFLENAAYPCGKTLLHPYLKPGSQQELEELLTYEWPAQKLERVSEKGTRIEVYLGAQDRVVDAHRAHTFFKSFGESYLFKDYGHILKGAEFG